MSESMHGILAEAKKAKFSLINQLSDSDVNSVWENVAAYIEKQMSVQKGVQIPNLGTFSFSQNRLDVGNNKFVLTQRPVFNISEKFAQIHGLQFTKYNVPGHIPSPPLNFAALSFESPFDRDTVESCVREIVGSVSRAVAAKKNVELSFAGIGRLMIRDSRVKMRFYKEFINQMDGSGSLLESLQNRSGTVDSVMSNRPMSRPATSNTVILPRIQPTNFNSSLAPVTEQDENLPSSHPEPVISASPNDAALSDHPEKPEATVPQSEIEQQIGSEAINSEAFGDHAIGDPVTDLASENILKETELKNDPPGVFEAKVSIDDAHGRKGMLPVPRVPSRATLLLPKASGISIVDELATPKHLTVASAEPHVSMQDGFASPGRFLKPPTPPHLVPLHRSHSLEDLVHRQKDKPLTPPGTACGHPTAGQELCYLCHQRARRNVPVSFAEEIRHREEEEDKLLQQYQTMKDAEDLLKEQERFVSRRYDLQKAAAFNLGVAEAVVAKKKSKDTEPQRSYIFQRRPLTPSRFPRQEKYLQDLNKQVEVKEQDIYRKKSDEQFLERLEQVQLAEDLAAQREQYIRDKAEQMEAYKRALDTQLRYKPLPIPRREPDIEIFGKNDMTNEKLAERRRRAQLLLQEQQEMVGQRKREAILRQLAEQERDQMVLERAKQELQEDRALRYRANFDSRRRLQEDWHMAAEMKRGRELEDRLIGLESGILLHEQCDRYHRCKQCKRHLNNCGESNIWAESRYIPGSRIMV